MTEWSPPAIPRTALLAAGVLWVLWLAYCLFVIQEILLGLLPVIVFAVLYLVWRFLAAIEAIADAQQRLAAERERGRD